MERRSEVEDCKTDWSSVILRTSLNCPMQIGLKTENQSVCLYTESTTTAKTTSIVVLKNWFSFRTSAAKLYF
jgi:hypothetical protein